MVKLQIKRGTRSCFLYETTVNVTVGELLEDLTFIYNGCLKIETLCTDMEELAKYGVYKQPDSSEQVEEQIERLNISDEEKYTPLDGYNERNDPAGKRCGKAPNDKAADIMFKVIIEARTRVSEKQIEGGICLTRSSIEDAFDMLKGAVEIVYPKGLPMNDPVYQKLNNKQASKEFIELREAQLWWAGKELAADNKLSFYVGRNEKTKIICKLQKCGEGAPAREPTISEDIQKEMILRALERAENQKNLDDDSFLESTEAADTTLLRKSFQGLKEIKWKP